MVRENASIVSLSGLAHRLAPPDASIAHHLGFGLGRRPTSQGNDLPLVADSPHPEGTKACRTPVRVRDRKSTRLNSSHTVISYAVFCLKKKSDSYQSTLETN